MTALAILGGCGLYGLVNALRGYVRTTRPVVELLCDNAFSSLCWALVVPFLIAAATALPVRGPHRLRNGLLLAAACLVLAAGPPMIYVAVIDWKWVVYLLEHPMELAADAYDGAFITALVTVVTQYLGLTAEASARARAEAALSREIATAELRRLRADLHPHFLFNALNGVTALLRENPAEARRVLRVLTELLQRSFAWSDREIPLAEEVRFAERYLEIQRMRFGDRLSVRIDVPAGLGDCLVPPLILQPLVENAVIHGVARHPFPGTVTLRAAADGARLRLLVHDTGPAPVEQPRARPAMGIANVRARLQLLYGDGQALTLRRDDVGFEAAVTIPLAQRREVAA